MKAKSECEQNDQNDRSEKHPLSWFPKDFNATDCAPSERNVYSPHDNSSRFPRQQSYSNNLTSINILLLTEQG
jgi:hypothetical protein